MFPSPSGVSHFSIEDMNKYTELDYPFPSPSGVSHFSMISRVLRNEAYFSQDDITQSVEILDIPQDEIGAYFFTKQVHKSETEVNEMH